MKAVKQVKKVNMDEIIDKLIANMEFIDKAIREGKKHTLQAKFKKNTNPMTLE